MPKRFSAGTEKYIRLTFNTPENKDHDVGCELPNKLCIYLNIFKIYSCSFWLFMQPKGEGHFLELLRTSLPTYPTAE